MITIIYSIVIYKRICWAEDVLFAESDDDLQTTLYSEYINHGSKTMPSLLYMSPD